MKFGQYELLEPIAVGGMAEVFKGRVVAAEGFEKLVAIKRILPDLAEDDRFVKMLLTEARIHSALSHRNIVQIHDLGISEDGQYFIVLEYVEGYDLRIITEQLAAVGEIVPGALSLHIASEVAQGLHFAHELRGPDGQPLGLIHRDVTPSNILISLAGEVKLSDFGLAKRRHDRSVVGSLKGNLSYMSPEQAKQSPLDRRTDVFSLGVVLFELLTGRRLREITDEVAGWTHVASGAIPSARTLRPDLPPVIGALLDRALAADPAERFPDAASFGAAIRDAMAALNVPVGASDLAALIRALDPPRKPRILTTERSRVIRLGPEARALREAIEAPATPAPIPIAIPPRKTAPLPGLIVAATSARDPKATPGPRTPSPPPRPRSPTPRTPPAAGDPGRRPSSPSLPPLAASNGAPAQPMLRAPTASQAMPPRDRPVRPTPAVAQTALRASPAQGLVRPAMPTPRFSPVRAFPAAPALPPAPVRHPRETERVQPLGARPRWRLALVLVLVAIAGAGAAVHRFLVPLDVLLAWRTPGRLAIATEPEGASLRLDGIALGAASPTVVPVRRDLMEHVIEATHPGFKPARAIVRYDKSMMLSSRLVLQRDPLVAPPAAMRAPAPRAPAPPPPPPPSPVRTAGSSKRKH
jgi:serine/threonine protein kinase